MAIVQRLSVSEIESRWAPLRWQESGLSFTKSGYGRRIPLRYMVRLPGSKRWRRVYCACFSNNGTAYVEKGDDWIVITD